MDIYERTREIIKNNRYLSLATYNNEDIWNTPLSYTVDENYNFYFVTAIDSKHIEHISENPYVAFTIFNSNVNVSDVDGLQVKGVVGQVSPSELPKVIELYYNHVFPDPIEREEWRAPIENFTSDKYPVYRFFQILPTEIYKRDTINTDIDRRVKIDLSKLKGLN